MPLNSRGYISFSLVLVFSSLWVTHSAGMKFGFIMIVTLLPSCCSFFFVFGHRVSLLGGFQCLPVDGCSTASCNFGALRGGDEHMSFYSRSRPRLFFFLVLIHILRRSWQPTPLFLPSESHGRRSLAGYSS